MRRLAVLLFIFSAMLSAGCSITEMRQENSAKRYVFCNVYLEDSCFGIAGGDSLQMSIPGDYMIYQVAISGGMTAMIYSGYNPEDRNDNLLKSCSQGHEYCAYQFERNDAIDAYYSAGKGKSYLHVSISGINEKNILYAQEFLENFRECKSENNSLICGNRSIFYKIYHNANPVFPLEAAGGYKGSSITETVNQQ